MPTFIDEIRTTHARINGMTFALKKEYPRTINVKKVFKCLELIIDTDKTLQRAIEDQKSINANENKIENNNTTNNATIINNANNNASKNINTQGAIKESETHAKNNLDICKKTISSFFDYIQYAIFDEEKFIWFISNTEQIPENKARAKAKLYILYMKDERYINENTVNRKVTYQFNVESHIEKIEDSENIPTNDDKAKTKTRIKHPDRYVRFNCKGMSFRRVYIDYYINMFNYTKYEQFKATSMIECFESLGYHVYNTARQAINYHMTYAVKIGLVKKCVEGDFSKAEYKFIIDPNDFPFMRVKTKRSKK